MFFFCVRNERPNFRKQKNADEVQIKNTEEVQIENTDEVQIEGTSKDGRKCDLSVNFIYAKEYYMESASASITSSCRGPCQVNSAIPHAFELENVKGVRYAENSANFSDFDINWLFGNIPNTNVNGFELNFNYTQTKVLLGPNVLEGDNDNFAEKREIWKEVYHIAPSEWVADSWKSRGWHNTLGYCPTPVNTDKWSPSEYKIKRNFGEMAAPYHDAKCILYLKRIGDTLETAHPILYEKAKNWLNSLNIKCEELIYDAYDNDKLYRLGQESDFALIIDGTETQGYALLSIMSMDIPIFLMLNSIGQMNLVAPYFDKKISGSFATKQTADNENLKIFLKNLIFFQPRKIMLEKVSYKASVLCLTNFLCDLKFKV